MNVEISSVDWEAFGLILGAIALTGAAVTALPPIWRFFVRVCGAMWFFLNAAVKAPLVIGRILEEFSPNGGGSMRDSIDKLNKTTTALLKDAAALRMSNHELIQEITAVVGTAHVTARSVEKQAKFIADQANFIAEHSAEDKAQFVGFDERLTDFATQFEILLGRLDGIDAQLKEAKGLAKAVKHDLGQSKEIDILARQGRLERREQDYQNMLAQVEILNQQLFEMNERYQAEAEKVATAAGVVAENLAVAKEGVEKVASDLAASHERANAVESDEPGAAADAALRLEVDENPEEGG